MTIFRVHQAQQPFRDVVNAANSQCFSRCWSREQGDLVLPNLLRKWTRCAEWWVNGCVAWTCVRLCQAISLAGAWRGAHPRFQVILAMRTMVLCLHSNAHHGHSVRSSIWANKFMERLIPNPCWYLLSSPVPRLWFSSADLVRCIFACWGSHSLSRKDLQTKEKRRKNNEVTMWQLTYKSLITQSNAAGQ